MNPDSQLPDAPFRMRPQVFQVIALLLVALALPITIVILGILNWSSPSAPAVQAPPAEIEALRHSVENIAAEHLSVPGLDDGRRVVEISAAPDELVARRAAVESAVRVAGGTALPDGDSILISIPGAAVAAFEQSLGIGAVEVEESASGEETRLYRFTFITP